MTSDDEQKAIEEAFVESWDWTQRYFKDDTQVLVWLEPIQKLINDLRERGYNRQLRAGRAMLTLILSRSLEHGLRPEQARISFHAYPQGNMHVTYVENNQKAVELNLDHVAITPEIETLLTRLLAHPID